MSFSDPDKNISHLDLLAGMHVADFGSGSGFYTIAAAQEVGKSGVVYAVDIQKDLLTRTQRFAREQELANIEIVWADLEKENGSTLSPQSLDAVVLSNTLFQIENKEALVKEAYRVLKIGGKLLVIDWSDSFGGLGPKTEDIVPEHAVRTICEEVGFTIGKTVDAGAHHYGFIAVK